VSRLISYAQNGEDVRLWRAFAAVDLPASGRFTYIDVGANHPFELSITASLYELGWRGVLVEADPDFAAELRRHRPLDQVIEMAAGDREGEITFYRVAGTGLGTLSEAEAGAASAAGFDVSEFTVATATVNQIVESTIGIESPIHFMSIDVEGAEPLVLAGLDLNLIRPWVVCIEAIDAETKEPNHAVWESLLLEHNYIDAAFDGINRWYVAQEHGDLAALIAVPLNPIDAGKYGWISSTSESREQLSNKAYNRVAWQRAQVLNQAGEIEEGRKRDAELERVNAHLAAIQQSRGHRIAQPIDKVLRKTKATALGFATKLPRPLRNWTVRKRHLRIVNPALLVYTDPAFLTTVPEIASTWVNPELKPEVPVFGCGLGALTSDQIVAAQNWIDSGPFDSDALLESRTDGINDELGRTTAAMRTRLRLAAKNFGGVNATTVGTKILFDARCLQTATFGARGIGRFALAALNSVRENAQPGQLVLLIDKSLADLPPDLCGESELVESVQTSQVKLFGQLIQPSPMTASPDPIIELLHSHIKKTAIVFDFIPLHYPSVYLRHAAQRVEYAVHLDALSRYNEFLCISALTKSELVTYLTERGIAASSFSVQVVWPAAIQPTDSAAKTVSNTGPIVVMTGDEARKNTFGALAAIGVATSGDSSREVCVLGMAHRPDHVHHLSIAAAMRPGEATALARLSDSEMHALLQSASLIVVPSFDEGLSLPLLEAISAGTPIVASDIAAHRELIGSGSYLADPANLNSFARAISKHIGRSATHTKQRRKLAGHQHATLEAAIKKSTSALSPHQDSPTIESTPVPAHPVAGRKLSIGFATPWSPQKSGVADFSTIIGIELARLADLTVYTTSDADVPASLPPGVSACVKSVEELFARNGEHDHDVLVSVVGNSHFHLPFIELRKIAKCVVVAHDTRMNEFYMALRGIGGLQELMLRTENPAAPLGIDPPIDQQISDMRLLQNAALWEVTRNAQTFVSHSPAARERIGLETGVDPVVVTFPNYRSPEFAEITPQLRADAKARLGFDSDRIHLTSLGFIDIRTKMSDVVVESAAWLQQWGHPVSLHLAGAGSEVEVTKLNQQAQRAGLVDFEITGFLTDEAFRDYLLATDVGIQLRISSLLGVSGPLADLAGFGVACVASSGLVQDIDAPSFVSAVPEYVSPVMVARSVEQLVDNPVLDSEREILRLEYLESHSPEKYAREFLSVLQDSVDANSAGN